MSDFRCLALETGAPTSSVAACNGDRHCELLLPSGRKAAAALFETIDDALARVDLSLENLDCIAFGRGPGTFTGLRVAVAAAQGLGLGMDLKLCGVSSLAALAQDAWDRERPRPRRGRDALAPSVPRGAWIAPCLPAGRDQVYIGWYRIGKSGLVSAVAEDWLSPVEACSVPGSEPFVAAGKAWAEFSAMQSQHAARIVALEEGAMPRARAVLRLAFREYTQGRLIAPEEARPVYLRSAV